MGVEVAITSNKSAGNRRNFILQRPQSIILQYFYVALASLLIYTLVFSPAIDYMDATIQGILTGNVVILGYNQAIWFLTMIFLSNIMFYGVIKLSDKICKSDTSKNLSIFAISIIIFAVGYFTLNKGVMLWSIDIALLTMPFNYLGYLLFKYPNKILERFKAIYIIPLSIILILITMTRPYTNLASRFIGNPVIYFLLASLAIVILFKVCNMLAKHKKISNMLSILGENSLIIMSYHMVLHTILYSAIVPKCHKIYN